jgi:calcineurin-like phosphoesterase
MSKPIGTLTNVQENGKNVMTVGVQTSQILDSLDKSNRLVIPAQYPNQTETTVSLRGDGVKLMEEKYAVLEVQTSQASYVIPASEMNMDAISEQLGPNVSLADIKLHVTITEPTQTVNSNVTNIETSNSYTTVADPVLFLLRVNTIIT